MTTTTSVTSATRRTTDTAVRATGLTKTYGPQRAVDAIDLRVERGEIFALLGPNGAGKTTATEILEGYRRRDGGDVEVLGTDPEKGGTAWRARIGVVLQSGVSSDDELTVLELVRHFATFYRPRSYDPDELVAAVGLQDCATTRVRRLSGGQRRRVDVALGIVGRPELLFLDEPTTGFDPAARREFWALIRSLAVRGTTVLLTTHYLDEAEHLADRVAVMARGRIVALDTPARLGARQHDVATVRWCEDGGSKAVETPAPTELVQQLARRFGGEVPELSVTRPTLEDTYLRLIGDQS
jgi:ABC-2 type transport system ATP-binding protein